MKLGLQIVRFNWDGVATDQIGATVARIGQTADAAGFDSLWVMDHFFQMEFPAIGFEARQPMFDGYTLLSFLAGITCHATLGTLVTVRPLPPSRPSDQDGDRPRRAVRRTGDFGHWGGLV